MNPTTKPRIALATVVLLAALWSLPAAAALHGTVEIAYRNQDGSLRTPVRWALGDHGRALAQGNFDGAGGVDLLVGYETLGPGGMQSHVGILLGDGTGNFSIGPSQPVGSPDELIVGLQPGSFVGIFFLDFDVYLSLDPAAPAPLTTRHRYAGQGDGTFLLNSSLPGVSPPAPLPDGPLAIDLDGNGQADQAFVNRRAEQMSDLPIAAAATPGDVNGPDAFAQPLGAAFPGTIGVTVQPTIADPCVEASLSPCLTIYYTVNGSTPAPNSNGTHTLTHPFSEPLYFHQTTTLTFFARRDDTLDAGPIRQQTYEIAQSPHVDTDGDGIPDAYEILANGKLRPGFDPFRTNEDSDGDGIPDAAELLQGTNPFSAICLGGDNAGAFCDGAEDCLPTDVCVGGVDDGAPCTDDADCALMQCGYACSFTCVGGAIPGSPCVEDADCTAGGTCGDGPVVHPRGTWFLDGTAENAGPALPGSNVLPLTLEGKRDYSGVTVFLPNRWTGLQTSPNTTTVVGAVDDAEPDGDVLLTRIVADFQVPSADPGVGWTGGDAWLAAAQAAYGQDQFLGNLALSPGSSAMVALAGHEAGELLAFLGVPPPPENTRLGREDRGLSESDLLSLFEVTDLPTHAYLIQHAVQQDALALFDVYAQFAGDLFAEVEFIGVGELTPTDGALAQHLEDGTIPEALEPGMAARGYTPASLVAIAERARAESGALSGAVQGAVALDAVQDPASAAAGIVGPHLDAVRARADLLASVVDQANGDLMQLAAIEGGGLALAAACLQAEQQEGGTEGALLEAVAQSSVDCGSGVLLAALVAAGGTPSGAGRLAGNMPALIHDIIQAACDPGELDQLSTSVGDYLLVDVVPPTTTASPGPGLFPGPVLPVTLSADEQATLYVRTDGVDPAVQEPGTIAYPAGTALLVLAGDADVRYFSVDIHGNAEAVQSAVYRLDRDADGVPDVLDNCVYDPNAAQADGDGDGVGDACDGSLCGNGIQEPGEACDDGDLMDGDGCTADCQPQKLVDLATDPADWTALGEAAGQSLGSALAVGELDGDGIPDVAMAAGPGAPVPGVRIVSAGLLVGTSPRDLATAPAEVVLQDASGAACGAALLTVDWNDDGRADLLIGCPGWDPPGRADAGAVFLYLGPVATAVIGPATADVTVYGEIVAGELGAALGTGDRDGDAIREMAIGAPGADIRGAVDAGRAVVVEVPAGASLVDLTTTAPLVDLRGAAGWRLGTSVALGDTDRDGSDELAVGAPAASPMGRAGAGAVYLYPDAGAAVGGIVDLAQGLTAVAELRGAAAGDGAGRRVRLVDADGDGRADAIVSAPGADAPGGPADVGTLYVDRDAARAPGNGIDLAGSALGLTVVGADGGGALGSELIVADLDGDGRPELIAGAPMARSGDGMVVALSVDPAVAIVDLSTDVDGAVALIHGGSADDHLGAGLAAGDVDGVPPADLVAAAPDADPQGRSGAGEVHAFSMEAADHDHDGLPDPVDLCPWKAVAHIPAYLGETDLDGDGIGDACDNCPLVPNAGQIDADGDGTGEACDLYPNLAPVHPCDGVFDLLQGYADTDGDGWGDACDCSPLFAGAYPGAPEVCDGLDSDCNGVLLFAEADADGDGWAVCLGDCADADPARHPGAVEVCNGVDDDCDAALPPDEVDGDRDGDSICQGDCDDTDPAVGPGQPEVCRNGVDDDCNGEADGQEMVCQSETCVVLALSVGGGELSLSLQDPNLCDPSAAGALRFDLIRGDVASLLAEAGKIDLGTVASISCADSGEQYLFDPQKPPVGAADFFLARETGAADYGQSSAGLGRVPDAGDCP